MSTLDNSYQFSDDLIETEARLLSGKSKVDLTLYERNSMNKINFRSYLGKNFICSTHDKYRKIRVPITAVFLKVLETKSQKNLERMQSIKRIIYSSTLQQIVNKHAITSEQLLSNFAFAINQLENQRQNLESSFIKKMNSEPFFDKIIMQSLYETFYDPSHEMNLTTRISKWIKSQLGISIIFVQNQTQVESESVIFLRRGQKNEVLRQVKQFHICSMSSIIDESKDIVTPLKPSNRKINQINSSSKLLQSISSIQSQNARISQKPKSIEHLIAISVHNSVELLNNKQNDFIQQRKSDDEQNFPISRRKIQSSESRFWKIFCCSSD